MNNEWEVMLEVGAAGGKISLYGKNISDNKWRFKLKTQENALIDMLDDEELDVFDTETKSVGGWNEAFNLLSRYPWIKMYPLKIHPIFKPIVWNKINNDECIDYHPKWYILCCDTDNY